MPKRNRFRRTRRKRRFKRLVLVATEGERTEPIYFDGVRKLLGRNAEAVIQVLPARRGRSAPGDVLKRLKRAARDKGARKGDVCWVVLDRNSWTKRELREVAKECARLGYGFGISNPCFELWLVLHLPEEKSPLRKKDCDAELVRQLGNFDKRDYDADALLENIDDAIERAERLENNSKAIVPSAPGTRLYTLVKEILSVAS